MMSTPENEIRATLNHKAEEASVAAGVALPQEITRRVHRRQARTVLIGSLTLTAFVSLAVLATRAFQSPENIGQSSTPAEIPFTVFDPPIELGEESFRLASGEAPGESWNLFASKENRAGRGVELEIHTSGGQNSFSGGFTVPETASIETNSVWVGNPAVELITYGAVVSEAAGTWIESSSGRITPGSVIPLPDSLRANFKVLLVEASGELEGELVVTDAEGQEIVREQYFGAPPPPPPPTVVPAPPLPPGGRIPQLDHFGNTVGYLPWEQAVVDPSGPPGALEEGFAWVTPGLQPPEVTVDEIRATASVSLTQLWSAVRSWWESRPNPAATDSAFLRWWAAYPIGTEPQPLPTMAEITPQG